MRNKILFISKYMKYLGILGLPRFIFEYRVFDFLWLFWLFGIVEIALNYSIIMQSILQVFGILWIKIRYGKNMPGTNNYQGKIAYSLPFAGRWTVVNGGITKDFSHSWDIPV